MFANQIETSHKLHVIFRLRATKYSRRMRRAGHLEHIGRGEVYTVFLLGNLRERDNLEDPGVDGRIILRWIFRKWDGSMGRNDLAQDRDR